MNKTLWGIVACAANALCPIISLTSQLIFFIIYSFVKQFSLALNPLPTHLSLELVSFNFPHFFFFNYADYALVLHWMPIRKVLTMLVTLLVEPLSINPMNTGVGLSDQKLCPDFGRPQTQCLCNMFSSRTSNNNYWFWRWDYSYMAFYHKFATFSQFNYKLTISKIQLSKELSSKPPTNIFA